MANQLTLSIVTPEREIVRVQADEQRAQRPVALLELADEQA